MVTNSSIGSIERPSSFLKKSLPGFGKSTTRLAKPEQAEALGEGAEPECGGCASCGCKNT